MDVLLVTAVHVVPLLVEYANVFVALPVATMSDVPGRFTINIVLFMETSPGMVLITTAGPVGPVDPVLVAEPGVP
jgi:hypothetical protein